VDDTSRLPARRQLLLGLLVLVLLAGAGWGAWVWTHPTLFPDAGIERTFYAKPVGRAGGTVEIGYTAARDPETITLHAVVPHFSTDTARSTVNVVLCYPRNKVDRIDSLVTGDSLASYCRTVRPVVDGVRFRVDAEADLAPYLLATVVPTAPGTTRIDAFTYDYSRSAGHGWQHGKDRAAQITTVPAT